MGCAAAHACERELFGGRVRAEMLGGETVMRAEQLVRSMRPSAAAAATRGRSSAACAVRPFELVGMHDGVVCVGVWGRRSYGTRAGRSRVECRLQLYSILYAFINFEARLYKLQERTLSLVCVDSGLCAHWQ